MSGLFHIDAVLGLILKFRDVEIRYTIAAHGNFNFYMDQFSEKTF